MIDGAGSTAGTADGDLASRSAGDNRRGGIADGWLEGVLEMSGAGTDALDEDAPVVLASTFARLRSFIALSFAPKLAIDCGCDGAESIAVCLAGVVGRIERVNGRAGALSRNVGGYCDGAGGNGLDCGDA